MSRLLKGLCAELGALPETGGRCYSANPANPDVSRAAISEISRLAARPDSHGDGLPALAMRDHLLILADAAGIDRAHVNALDSADLAACAGLDERQLTGYLDMVRDTADRHAGRVPLSDTAAMHCKRCGPVWIHPDVATVLPVVSGWPRALGCPWCFVREAGGCIPRPPLTCEDCRHFIPDTINPEAGMGTCASGHGMSYPTARHACADHTTNDHDET